MDGCQALVLDSVSIFGSQAASGGAISVSDTQAVLLAGSNMLQNMATGNRLAASVPISTRQSSARNVSLPKSAFLSGSLSAVEGMGGSILIQGATSTLIYRSAVEHNTAGSHGGGLSVTTSCTPQASGAVPLSSALPKNMSLIPAAFIQTMSQLVAKSQSGCHSTELRENSFRYNTANVRQGDPKYGISIWKSTSDFVSS